ncbi:hypothetical protein AGMMS50256_19590 [Betaproteobacteria bacterium]|nr:hypothetical protein AGMMS50256_19590 [Betaproteobacteria bacterium]
MTQSTSNTRRVVSSLGVLGRGRNPGQRLLVECRDRLSKGLCDWLRGVSATISEELFVLADSTWERLLQTRYLDLRTDIEKDWEHLIETFSRNLSSEIERRQDLTENGSDKPQTPLEIPDFEGLELIDDADLSEHIVIREFSARLSETCDAELYTLNRRVVALLGNEENQDTCDNPLGPPAICQALSDSCVRIGADPESRLILLRRLERHLHASMPEIYKQINAYLIERGILPDLKRSYRKNPPAGGTVAGIAANIAAATGHVSGAQPSMTESTILAALQQLAQARAVQEVHEQAVPMTGSDARLQPAPTTQPPPPIAETSRTPHMPDAATINRLLLSSLNEYQRSPAEPDNAIVNHVKQVRDSEAAKQVGGLESVTMDIVATLFDLVFDDARIPIGIKALISRLQIPVLKVAMLNPGFFGDRMHPTRRFIAGISGISIRWSGAVDESDPLYVKLSELVERIQREFEEDVEIFGRAVDELNAFVDEREAEEDDTALVAANVVIQHEIETEAWERAQQAVRSFLQSAPQPAAVSNFLEEHWTAVLQRIATGGGETEADWESAIQVIKDLAWSITPKKLPDERLKLISLLPHLLGNLNKGLDRINESPARRNAFFDALVKLHSAALKGETSEQMPEKTPPEPPREESPPASMETGDLLIMRSVDNGIQVKEVILVGAPPILDSSDQDLIRQVNALNRGDWVEFIDNGQVSRERLNWISPQRGILLFSNHRSAKAISITPEALARQIHDGKAAIVHEEAIFERALSGALESVNAL